MDKATIAIVGGGNMGASLLGGLIAKAYPREKLLVSDQDTEKLKHLNNHFQIHTTTNNQEAIKHADIIILAVKPQIITQVVHEMTALVQQRKPLIISIAAGVREASIQKWLGGQIAIVRAMPNTPALIGCGATALYANKFVSKLQRELSDSILGSVGQAVWVTDEKWMDAITALSGSGPAYFFLMIEAMQNAAIELGLPKETARLMTLQTAYGASRMALESDVDVVELRRRVTSPGGTTEQALKVLEEYHLRDIFKHALSAAKKRSEELSELIEQSAEK